MQHKIMVVDDEADVIDMLVMNLRSAGFQVITVEDGATALVKARNESPSLIILDLMLPKMPGLEICKVLKGDPATRHIPVIMLTAKAEEVDKIVGLELGADDYVTKPFSVKVLLQRIKALQRRVGGAVESASVIEHQGVRIDRVAHRAFVGDRELDLTPTEFRLLECLLRQPGRAFTRHHLMDAAIGDGAVVLERTIDVHIKTLRRKLDEAGELIETVRGVGYRFAEGTR
jgi:two-component system, OmpR family, phosphate regulon response regulator PhoB